GRAAFLLRDARKRVAFAGSDTLEKCALIARFFEFVAHGLGNALTVGLLIVQYSNFFRLDMFDDNLGCRWALLIVAPNGAEDHVIALAVGNGRRGGRRRNHDDTFVVINVGSSNGSARTNVADDIIDAVVDDTVSDHGTLLGFTGIVHQDDFYFFA